MMYSCVKYIVSTDVTFLKCIASSVHREFDIIMYAQLKNNRLLCALVPGSINAYAEEERKNDR